MRIRVLLFILLTVLCNGVNAQIGGTSTYRFLDLTNSARSASLGGNVIAVYDDDINLTYHNPALLTGEMSDHIALSYVNYFSGINYGYVSYAKKFNKWGNFAGGIQYVNYGKFTAADETGRITGTFKAAEYAMHLLWSHEIDSFFTFGADLKFLYSQLEHYYSSGIAADFGITYHNPDIFTAALVVKNFGRQLKPFVPGNIEPLPFDIQLGISRKLPHAPVRLILNAQHIQKLNLLYDNPNDEEQTEDPITGEPIPERKFARSMDNIGRHFIAGIEIIPVKNFYIRFGYNYQRRREMKVPTRPFLVGMSIGAGVRIYKFHFSYGRAQYHLAGATNHFSVSTNIADFYRKVQNF